MVCMTDEARAARRQYMRRWRSEHRESVARANAKYWAKKAREMGLADSDQDTEERHESEAVTAHE